MMRRYAWGEAKAKVAALADGTRTYREIAVAAGVSQEYVRAAVQRLGLRDKVMSQYGDRKKPTQHDLSGYISAKVDDWTRQAIIDRAVATGKTVAEVCGVLLAVAVDVGDLETHFPVPTP